MRYVVMVQHSNCAHDSGFYFSHSISEMPQDLQVKLFIDNLNKFMINNALPIKEEINIFILECE